MNAMIGWLGRQAPDVIATVRRFPLAILLLALGTVVALALANEWYRDDEDTAGWLAVGLLTGPSMRSPASFIAKGAQGRSGLPAC